MKSLVLGAGYLGTILLKFLKTLGHTTTAWTLNEDSKPSYKDFADHIIQKDASTPNSWKHLPEDSFDYVFFCLATSGGGSEAYTRIHRHALQLALKHLSTPKTHFIYSSSTSVYGQQNGEWVHESSPTNPISETSKILLEAEKDILESQGTVARIGAIYGPGRGFLFKRFLKGEAVLEQKGLRWMNQIHRDDVANGLIHLSLTTKSKGQVYNLTDSNPVQYTTFYHWLSQTFSKPLPPVSTNPPKSKRRGLSNKRVSNAKLLDTGFTLKYPSYEAGYINLDR